MSHRKPTLRDLAKELNLALSTVSTSLKDDPRISKATRERVKAMAKKMGYVPDPRISNVMGYLKKKRADKPVAALGYITKHSEQVHLEKHRVYYNYLRGARQRAEELGYRLDYFNLKTEGLSGERLSSMLFNRGIEGILIPPIFTLHESLNLRYEQFASITFGYSLENDTINRVSLNHFAAVSQSFEEIAKKGYRRIGFISGRMQERTQNRWKAAHLMFLDMHEDQEKIPPLEQKYDRDIFLKWFFKYKPNVILDQKTDSAQYLFDEGLICGKDYGFATLSKESSDHEVSQMPHPDLRRQLNDVAGLNQNSLYTGRYAVEFLAQEIALNQKGHPIHPKVTLIKGTWEDGETLPDHAELQSTP